MAGPTRISQLTDGSPVESTDQIPIARGSGSTGYTYKTTAGRIISDLLNIESSPTVDLNWDASTRTLSADWKADSVNAVSSDTVDLNWNSSTRTLSAAISTAVKNVSAFNVIDSSTVDLNWDASTRTLSASVSSISSFFAGTNQSLTANGYQKLPGGLIIQWGNSTYSTNGAVSYLTLTWPIAFPNNCLNAITTVYSSPSNYLTTDIMGVAAVNATQGTFTGSTDQDGVRGMDLWWLAIGY